MRGFFLVCAFFLHSVFPKAMSSCLTAGKAARTLASDLLNWGQHLAGLIMHVRSTTRFLSLSIRPFH